MTQVGLRSNPELFRSHEDDKVGHLLDLAYTDRSVLQLPRGGFLEMTRKSAQGSVSHATFRFTAMQYSAIVMELGNQANHVKWYSIQAYHNLDLYANLDIHTYENLDAPV